MWHRTPLWHRYGVWCDTGLVGCRPPSSPSLLVLLKQRTQQRQQKKSHLTPHIPDFVSPTFSGQCLTLVKFRHFPPSGGRYLPLGVTGFIWSELRSRYSSVLYLTDTRLHTSWSKRHTPTFSLLFTSSVAVLVPVKVTPNLLPLRSPLPLFLSLSLPYPFLPYFPSFLFNLLTHWLAYTTTGCTSPF